MKRIILLLLLILMSSTSFAADNKVLWAKDGVESGGGGWWFSSYITDRLREYGSSIPPHILAQLVQQGVSYLKQQTITPEGQRHYWYWYGFRFRKTDAKGLYIVGGPGSVLLTFTDPEDPTNTFTLLDDGILVSCDQEHNSFRDTRSGSVVVRPYEDDSRRLVIVWCLIRLPKRLSDGTYLDRICTLDGVEPVENRWEVIP